MEGRQITKLDNPTVGLSILPIEQTIIVVCMNKTLECFSKKGKQLWSVGLSQSATCMVPIVLTHLSLTLICVALHGGLVQLYLHKDLVDQFTVSGKFKIKRGLFDRRDDLEGTFSSKKEI